MPYNVDWAATGTMVQGIATFAGAIAVVYAAKLGSNTFGLWKRQKAEEKRMDVAERILTLAYRIQRNFSAIRSPATFSHEESAAEEKLGSQTDYAGLSDGQKRRARTAQAIMSRIARYQSDWDEIFELMPLGRAIFGEAVENHLQDIWRQVVAVNVSAESYSRFEGDDPDYRKKIERDIWEIGGKYADEDEVGKKLKAALGGLEDHLLPVIRQGLDPK